MDSAYFIDHIATFFDNIGRSTINCKTILNICITFKGDVSFHQFVFLLCNGTHLFLFLYGEFVLTLLYCNSVVSLYILKDDNSDGIHQTLRIL